MWLNVLHLIDTNNYLRKEEQALNKKRVLMYSILLISAMFLM